MDLRTRLFWLFALPLAIAQFSLLTPNVIPQLAILSLLFYTSPVAAALSTLAYRVCTGRWRDEPGLDDDEDDASFRSWLSQYVRFHFHFVVWDLLCLWACLQVPFESANMLLVSGPAIAIPLASLTSRLLHGTWFRLPNAYEDDDNDYGDADLFDFSPYMFIGLMLYGFLIGVVVQFALPTLVPAVPPLVFSIAISPCVAQGLFRVLNGYWFPYRAKAST